jgi:hypothetical protein
MSADVPAMYTVDQNGRHKVKKRKKIILKKSQKLIFHICAERPLADGLEPNLAHSEIASK